MKKRNVVLIIIAAVLAVLILGGWITFSAVQNNLDSLKGLKLADIDLSQIPDGTYEGSFSMFPITAEVRVTVSGHEITQIDLIKHINGQGGAAEAIPGRVTDAQSLQVDAVSGATYSSQVILKAIENALTNAR